MRVSLPSHKQVWDQPKGRLICNYGSYITLLPFYHRYDVLHLVCKQTEQQQDL